MFPEARGRTKHLACDLQGHANRYRDITNQNQQRPNPDALDVVINLANGCIVGLSVFNERAREHIKVFVEQQR